MLQQWKREDVVGRELRASWSIYAQASQIDSGKEQGNKGTKELKPEDTFWKVGQADTPIAIEEMQKTAELFSVKSHGTTCPSHPRSQGAAGTITAVREACGEP